MSGLGFVEIMPFFVATAICLGLVITWMVSSESKRNICKAEITKLKTQLDSMGKEKMALAESAAAAENSQPRRDPADEAKISEDEAIIRDLREKNEALEKEGDRLRIELAEAKSSLEEVYKALCEQNPKKRGQS